MNTKKIIKNTLKYGVLIIISLISLFPFFWILVGMTNSTFDIMAGKLTFGGEFLNNWRALFASDLNFKRAFFNSLQLAVLTTVFALLISSLAGFGFEMYRSKKRDLVFNIILLSMMVPFAALMIPLFRMFSKISGTGLSFLGLNSYFSVMIPSVATAFLIFFFRQNSKLFPKEIMEAARIDGLSEINIFLKIYFPTMKNVYAAAAIITFMNSWNNYLWPLIAIQNPAKRTLPIIISAMAASYTPNYGMIMLAIVLSTLPTAFLFFFMQKQFVEGMLGSVK